MTGDMYLLVGGPRDGQLVDAAPSGYRAPDHGGGSVPLFDGFEAEEAVWVGRGSDPSDAGASARDH